MKAMMGMSRHDHFPTASPGWWKPGGEVVPNILPEPLTEHWGMANSR